MAILQHFNNNIRSGDRARLIGRIVRSRYTTCKFSTLYRLLKCNKCRLLAPSEIVTTTGISMLLQSNVIEGLNKEL